MINYVYIVPDNEAASLSALLGINPFTRDGSDTIIDDSGLAHYLENDVDIDATCQTAFNESFEDRYGDTKVRDMEFIVSRDPSNSYRIYKYVTEDAIGQIESLIDPPKSMDYINSFYPKLQKKVETINEVGSLTTVEWWAYDSETNTWIEPVLKVWIDWFYANLTPIKALDSVLYAETFRQWILEDGTYKALETEENIKANATDVKYTYKRYHQLTDSTTAEYRLASSEGVRRRGNIVRVCQEGFITLTVFFVTSNDKYLAEKLGLSIIRMFSNEYTEYKENGDPSFIDLIDQADDTNTLTDILDNEILSGVSLKSVLDTIILATVDLGQGPIPIEQIVPGANTTATIRNYISDKLRGEF